MKSLLLLFVAAMMVCVLSGCESKEAFWNPVTGDVVTPEEHQLLPEAEQQKYDPVTVRQIKPDVAGKVDAGILATQGGVEIIRPFIPEPFATLAALILGGVGVGWQTFKKRQVKDRLDDVELGSEITKLSINKVIRPSVEVWKEFKKEQYAQAANTKAVLPMPNKL